jgi:flavin-dependent dehydrogenase
VVDASGINSMVRTTLPQGYGVENFPIQPDEKFYVVLRYITWEDSQKPRTLTTDGWTFYKIWVAPSFNEKGAIIGVGATGSFDHAEEVLEDFFKTIELPPYKVDHIERGVTPYHRPPYSFVGDGFLCMGDSACITKPFSGEGITATWTLCQIAAQVVGEALKKGDKLSRESLWNINVRYFRDQGAKFAGILATIPAAANTTKKENSYLFRKDVIFSEEDLTDMNKEFEMRLTTPKILKMFGVIVLGLFTGNYSLSSLKALLKSVVVSGKIRSHYEAYPSSPESFKAWSDTAELLWEKAGTKMQ